MNLLKKMFGQPQQSALVRRVNHKDPLVIESPTIGFMNLLGQTGQEMLQNDKAAISPMFRACFVSESEPPECDVLFTYLRILPDGRIEGSSYDLREIIGKSRAPIVVIASENEGSSYIAAAKRKCETIAKANLVMTMGRKGTVFPKFFRVLFEKMSSGKTMPVAWVELAPQIPGVAHENVPDTLFAAEISHIVFQK